MRGGLVFEQRDQKTTKLRIGIEGLAKYTHAHARPVRSRCPVPFKNRR
jgi:hypothetical protein